MKRKRYAGDVERNILTGMIVNSQVLGKIVAGLKSEPKPFRNKWSNQIFHWCRDFHQKYSRAPRGSIQALFTAYAETQKDEDTVELIEKHLAALSDDYKALSKEINEDYLVDQASRHFSEVRLARLNAGLEADLIRKDLDAAREKLATFQPVSFDARARTSVLLDKEAWLEAITAKEDQTLIHYPGALGEFFHTHLERDGFITFMGPEKIGKSWWLIDVAWRAAVRSKKRTIVFSVGDMSKRQMMQRFGTRCARRPIAAGKVVLPRKIRRREGGELQIVFDSIEHQNRIPTKEWMAAQERVVALTAHSSSLLELECTSNSTTSVEDIRISLDERIKEGWVPDVVVIDYADILAPERSSKNQDFRHQTNETWKALRRLSQDYHCLVVTATQSDAASYDARIIGKRNFSEDKRKLSHVTGMVGINQTDEEKRKGVYRLNWVLLREGVYYETRCVTVAGSLALANPAMVSTW